MHNGEPYVTAAVPWGLIWLQDSARDGVSYAWWAATDAGGNIDVFDADGNSF